MLIPEIRVAPTPELPTPAGGRVNVESRLSVRQAQAAQDILSIGFDCTLGTAGSFVVSNKLNAGFVAGLKQCL